LLIKTFQFSVFFYYFIIRLSFIYRSSHSLTLLFIFFVFFSFSYLVFSSSSAYLFPILSWSFLFPYSFILFSVFSSSSLPSHHLLWLFCLSFPYSFIILLFFHSAFFIWLIQIYFIILSCFYVCLYLEVVLAFVSLECINIR